MPGFTASTTALPNETSIVRGNVGMVGGYWDATFMTACTIVTGGTDVLIAGAYANGTASGGVTASSLAIKLNFDELGTATPGNIQLIPPGYTPSQGNWWAIVRVSGTNPTS